MDSDFDKTTNRILNSIYIFIGSIFVTLNLIAFLPFAVVLEVIFLAGLLYFYTFGGFSKFEKGIERRRARQRALSQARDFLKPYKKLFGNFTLSNDYCHITYTNNSLFYVFEKGGSGDATKSFSVGIQDFRRAENNMDAFFNMICTMFHYNTGYEQVREWFVKTHLIFEKGVDDEKIPPKIERVDINGASVDDIAKLAGISVVVAKKIVKRREKKPFATVDEFIRFINPKPHFKKQLKEAVTVGDVKIINRAMKEIDLVKGKDKNQPNKRIVDI